MVNLYDAFGKEDPALARDWGFSAIVRYRGKTFLFDSGTRADILAKNLAAKGIDPREIDFGIISHSHYDHIAGFDYILKVNKHIKMILPVDFFSLGGPSIAAFTQQEPDIKQALPREQCYFDWCVRTSGA